MASPAQVISIPAGGDRNFDLQDIPRRRAVGALVGADPAHNDCQKGQKDQQSWPAPLGGTAPPSNHPHDS